MRKVSQKRKTYLLKRSKDMMKKRKAKKKLEKMFNWAVEMGLIDPYEDVYDDELEVETQQ